MYVYKYGNIMLCSLESETFTIYARTTPLDWS